MCCCPDRPCRHALIPAKHGGGGTLETRFNNNLKNDTKNLVRWVGGARGRRKREGVSISVRQSPSKWRGRRGRDEKKKQDERWSLHCPIILMSHHFRVIWRDGGCPARMRGGRQEGALSLSLSLLQRRQRVGHRSCSTKNNIRWGNTRRRHQRLLRCFSLSLSLSLFGVVRHRTAGPLRKLFDDSHHHFFASIFLSDHFILPCVDSWIVEENIRFLTLGIGPDYFKEADDGTGKKSWEIRRSRFVEIMGRKWISATFSSQSITRTTT